MREKRNITYIRHLVRYIKTLIVLVGLFLGAEVYAADDVCMPRKSTGQDLDICKHLQGVQRVLVDSLPMKISKNITVQNVVAVKNLLTLTAVASYDRGHLAGIARSLNTTVESVLENHRTAVLNMACTNKILSAALYLGAEVHLNFIYNDGTSMTYVEARQANC